MLIYKLFDLSHTKAKDFLHKFVYPWQALEGLKDYIQSLGENLDKDEFDEIAPSVWVHKTAKLEKSALLKGPCIIDKNSEVRQCAFIRGAVLVGQGCVVGNSTEVKNSILFDKVQVPHFNYVGDSILGYKAHMGAGAVTSNVKSDKKCVFIRNGKERVYTGMKKVGAFLGDNVEVGCNSVLNPGTVVGNNTSIYPLSCVRGVIPPNSIYKDKDHIVEKS